MTKVAPGVALRAERHRNLRAVVALAITGMLGVACGTGAATRASSGSSASHQRPGSTAGCNSVTTCYSPQQIEAAYGIVPLLARGIDGRGQTVVLPELAEPEFPLPTSDIRQDLVEFDKLFGLPAAKLQVNASLAPSASPW
jgi:subtilase family serine protease